MADVSRPKGAGLFCILAREKRTGVIFRRGPSKWVQLIKWDLAKDTFEHGQWFNGRIYERRGDLSPDGEKLIYFAAKFKRTKFSQHYSWTAISRPPYFTALALWPKGDCWAGGGLFEDARHVLLNHSPVEAVTDPKFSIKGLSVRPNPQARGEDDPIYSTRLVRDGWKFVGAGKYELQGLSWVTKAPEVWEKLDSRGRFKLTMTCLGIHSVPNDDWYVLEFNVTDLNTSENYSLGRASWADWDRVNLVFAKQGKLFRWHPQSKNRQEPVQIADFNGEKPKNVAAPHWAKSW